MSDLLSVYHSSPAIAVIWDPDKPWHILNISDNITHLDYSQEDLLKRNDGIAGLIHPEDIHSVSHEISHNIQLKKTEFPLFYRILTRYHGFRWIEDRTSITYNDNGNPAVITSILWMSSSILTLMQQKEGSKVWNMLNARIRHDILNQLTAILGYLEISTDYISDTDILEFIKKEQAAAERIKEKLFFTREYQQIGLELPRWNNLSDLIRTAWEETGIVSLKIHCNIPSVWLFCDGTIKKAIVKIFENIPVHGKGADTVQISFYYSDSGDGHLLIEDNGCGISDDAKKRIFDLGYGSGGGTGLFLAHSFFTIPHFSITETGSPTTSTQFDILIPSENISRMKDNSKNPNEFPDFYQ